MLAATMIAEAYEHEGELAGLSPPSGSRWRSPCTRSARRALGEASLQPALQPGGERRRNTSALAVAADDAGVQRLHLRPAVQQVHDLPGRQPLLVERQLPA